MKPIIYIKFFLIVFFIPLFSFGQVENPGIVGEDTIAANGYFRIADSLYKASQYDSSNYYF